MRVPAWRFESSLRHQIDQGCNSKELQPFVVAHLSSVIHGPHPSISAPFLPHPDFAPLLPHFCGPTPAFHAVFFLAGFRCFSTASAVATFPPGSAPAISCAGRASSLPAPLVQEKRAKRSKARPWFHGLLITVLGPPGAWIITGRVTFGVFVIGGVFKFYNFTIRAGLRGDGGRNG